MQFGPTPFFTGEAYSMSKRAFHLIIVILSLLTSIYAQPELDLSFNGSGKVLTDLGAGKDVVYDVLVQPDDKIVAVGVKNEGADVSFFALARYNTDGTLDTSFGTGGIVLTQFNPNNTRDAASAAALQPDGKILAAGFAGTFTSGSWAVARYNTDGSLDQTFGAGGKVLTAQGNMARAIAIDQDGKIAVAGDYWVVDGPGQATTSQTMVARYSANGALELIMTETERTTQNGTINVPNAVAFQPDGKIVTGGRYNQNTFNSDAKIVRFNTDGSLDTSFSDDGRRTFDITTGTSIINAVAIQPDGKIVGVGTDGDFLSMRLNADGSFDPAFGGGDGLETAHFFGSTANTVVIRPNGKIVVAGTVSATTDAFGVAYYNADGSLDNSFSGDGKIDFRFDNGPTPGYGMALDHLGRIVIGGTRDDKFAVARLYTLDPVPVTITGRTVDTNGTPIRNIRVGLTDAAGQTRWAITSTFGFFVFDNVPTGQTYTLFVRGAKQYSFNTLTIGLNEAVTDADLTGTPHRPAAGAKDSIEVRTGASKRPASFK